MTTITIQLQDPYLVLPNDNDNINSSPLHNPQSSSSENTSPSNSNITTSPTSNQSTSSFSQHANIHDNQAPHTTPDQGTTPLRGTVILTLSKPIQVVSLAVKFDGSSSLSLSAARSISTSPIDRRIASYSRQHVRAQQFLIEPSPNPEHHVTLVAVNTLVPPTAGTASSTPTTPTTPTTTINTASTSDLSANLLPNQIAYPFEINIPNNIPVSISTPDGGTTYRLTVELTIVKSPSTIMSLFSTTKKKGPGSYLTTTKCATSNVLVYREGFLHSPPGSLAPLGELGYTRTVDSGCGNDACPRRNGLAVMEDRARPNYSSPVESDQSDGGITSHLEHDNNTPLEADIEENSLVSDSISHNWPGYLNSSVMLPFVQLPQNSKIEFRIKIELADDHPSVIIKYFQIELRERAIFRVGKIPKTQNAGSKHTTMAIVGIRDRPITTQRLGDGWPTVSSPADKLFEKTVRFSTPTSIRDNNHASSYRLCNPSTYGRISKQERQSLELEANNSTFNFSAYELGAIDIEIQHYLRFSTLINSKKSGSIGMELGDTPVIVRGVPSKADCDCTGLPTYLGSFATLQPTSEERASYESSRINEEFDNEFVTCLRTGLANRENGSILPRSLITESESGIEIDNDSCIAMIGLGERTPPGYDDIMDCPLMGSHFNEFESKSQISREITV